MNGQMQKLFRMFLVSILMLFTFTVNAQEQTITGKVYDVAGEPIIGANVLIQGTTQGVITDMEGAFRLKADPLVLKQTLKSYWKKIRKNWTK